MKLGGYDDYPIGKPGISTPGEVVFIIDCR